MQYLALNNNQFYLFSSEMGKVLGLTEGDPRDIVAGLNSLINRLYKVLQERKLPLIGTLLPSVQHNPSDTGFRNDPGLMDFLIDQYRRPPPGCPMPVLPSIHQENQEAAGTSLQFGMVVKKNCTLMRAWRSKNMTVHLPISSDDDTSEVIAALTDPMIIGAVAGTTPNEFKISIDLENNWHESFFGDLDHCISLFQQLDEKLVDIGKPELRSCFNFCYDHGHFVAQASQLNYEKDAILPRFFRQMGSRIKTLHLHCNDGSGDQHMLLGSALMSLGLRNKKQFDLTLFQENERLLLKNLPLLNLPAQNDWMIVLEVAVAYTFEELVQMATLILSNL